AGYGVGGAGAQDTARQEPAPHPPAGTFSPPAGRRDMPHSSSPTQGTSLPPAGGETWGTSPLPAGGERGRVRGSRAEAAHDHSAHDHATHTRGDATLKRDFIIALVLTLPLFVLEMGGHVYEPMHHWLMDIVPTQTLYYAYFALATAVIFGPGRRFLKTGLPALLRGAPEMNSLVAVGVLAAYGYSVVATFVPGLLPENAR